MVILYLMHIIQSFREYTINFKTLLTFSLTTPRLLQYKTNLNIMLFLRIRNELQALHN